MATAVKFPPVQQEFHPLGGGLDLVTPAIAISPGKTIDAQNFEPAVGGGYRRIDGYERFDGRSSPTASSYWIVPASLSASVAVGTQVTGATSGAAGYVLAVFASYLVCGRVTGTFGQAETLTVSGSNVGVTTGTMAVNGAQMPSDDADYALLAANDQRTLIQTVPGSGPIRGVWVYNDTVYAFRDSVDGTKGQMWKATSSGWTQITFQTELQFTSATAQINVGDIVTGGTSGATGTVIGALLRTGTWTANGVGSLIIAGTTGTFASGEAIKVGATQKATSSAASAPITRAPGGRVECFNYNFTGSTNSTKMYGADGVNTAFEFDGTNYFPIRTGMASDKPSHVTCHRGYLFLSFLGSVQYSALGNPYAWTVVLGGGELSTGAPVSGFLPQTGTSNGSSLAIFTSERTFILYGSSNTDFVLASSNFDIGYQPYTCQQVSNDAYGLTSRGIQALITTLNYGDFDYASVSHMVQPLVEKKRGLACASVTLRGKNQYRVFFTDGSALVVGLTGNKVSGLMPLNYGRPVRCAVASTLATGEEVCYFGSDDGYVYRDLTGTSQDGQPIEAWVRLPFNSAKSPRIRKRFRRSILEVVAEGYAQVNVSYELGYGNPNVQPSAPSADQVFAGAGGYWDQFTWDKFNWDAQFVSAPSISLDGTEKNISMLYYTRRAQDAAFTISGVTLISTPRVLER
jgi:hypothetical protein